MCSGALGDGRLSEHVDSTGSGLRRVRAVAYERYWFHVGRAWWEGGGEFRMPFHTAGSGSLYGVERRTGLRLLNNTAGVVMWMLACGTRSTNVVKPVRSSALRGI